MPSLEEVLATPQSQLHAGLIAGLDVLSANQTIRFTKYVRLVLPLDGYVFWVKADLVSRGALFNASAFNTAYPNEAPSVITDAVVIDVKGSLHYASDSKQEADENYTVNRVIFTAQTEIQPMNQIGPNVMFIAEFDGIKFAFSRRGKLYKEASIFHYVGDAVYAAMQSQLVDSLAGFDTTNVVVSNSLPIWLALNHYQQLHPFPATCPLPLYPAFLVPDNIPPAFGAVDIVSGTTEAMQAFPKYDPHASHSQLVMETVRLTLYGLRNFNAMDLVDFIFNYIGADGDPMGLMNMPVVRDEKRTQNELNVLAMKKSVEFKVNYYQNRVRDVARQLILSCLITYQPEDNV